MKKIIFTVIAFFAAAILAVSANAAVSVPCSGYTKPVKQEAPRPRSVVQEEYRRDVLGSKVPLKTHEAGDALTDTATKYDDTLISGQV